MTYSPALFAYALTPTVVPYGTGSHDPPITLMITVTNPTSRHVDCSRIVFVVPVGTTAGDLTDNASGFAPTPALGVDWDITSDQAGTLTAVPKAGCTGIDAGDSIAFLIAGIEVNGLPGLALVEVWEQTDQLRYSNLGISKEPPGLAITSFTANPVQIPVGGTSTLSWTTTGAQACTLSWAGGTNPNLPTSGTLPVTPDSTTTYTLTATSTPAIGQNEASDQPAVSQQLSVYVPQVQILSYGASPDQVAQDGKTTLSWLVNNAQKCRISVVNKDVDPVSGSLDVYPQLSGSYDLSASGFGRTVAMPAPVTVMPVTVGPFTASPAQIPPGQVLSSTLRWSTEWATKCSIAGIGTVPLSGSAQVNPAATTTYDLQPAGLNPPPTSVTVTVCPAITVFGVIGYPNSLQVAVVYQTVGGSVTAAIGRDGTLPYPTAGVILLTTPTSLRLTVSGFGLSSTVALSLPGVPGLTISKLNLACGYSVNAPGAAAVLEWSVLGGQPSGNVAAQTDTPFAGPSGTTTFQVGPGPSSGGDPWQLTLHLTSDVSPSGPTILMTGTLPSPVQSNPDASPPDLFHPPRP